MGGWLFPNHHRKKYGLQDENQLDFHLPAHVHLDRHPYHTELAAAIKDLTPVLKKPPPTESTDTLSSHKIAPLGKSILDAATQARRIFGTPQPVPPIQRDSNNCFIGHYHQTLPAPSLPPMQYTSPLHSSCLYSTCYTKRELTTTSPQATSPATRQRVVATPPLPATPYFTQHRMAAATACPFTP